MCSTYSVSENQRTGGKMVVSRAGGGDGELLFNEDRVSGSKDEEVLRMDGGDVRTIM